MGNCTSSRRDEHGTPHAALICVPLDHHETIQRPRLPVVGQGCALPRFGSTLFVVRTASTMRTERVEQAINARCERGRLLSVRTVLAGWR